METKKEGSEWRLMNVKKLKGIRESSRFFLVLAVLLLTAVLPVSAASRVQDTAMVRVYLVRQDPYPAVPGEPVSVQFKVENDGLSYATNLTVQVTPRYPLSLYGTDALVFDLGTLGPLQQSQDATQLNFKFLVDSNAADGDGILDVKYSYNDGSVYYTSKFNVTVESQTTDFSVMAKRASEFTTTLLVANAGKNAAESVVLDVGENAVPYDVGALASGGLASVEVSTPPEAASNGLAKVAIYYTDAGGARREVDKQVQFGITAKQDVEALSQTTSSAGSVSVSIVNTASNSLSGVVAQFEPTGESTVIGNLDAGDYTTVSFTLPSPQAANQTARAAGARNATRDNAGFPAGGFQRQGGNLTAAGGYGGGFLVRISYTDTLGERRVVERTVYPSVSSSGGLSFRGANSGLTTQQNRTGTSILSTAIGFVSSPTGYLSVGAGGIIAIIAAFALANRRRKKSFTAKTEKK